MLIKAIDIFEAHKKVKNDLVNKSYRMPKDFDDYFVNKLSKQSQETIQRCADYFNTKWRNIDLYQYMLCGFKVFKNFQYKDILNEKVLRCYIKRDKNIKREMEFNEELFMQSFRYVIKKYKISLDIYSTLQYIGNIKQFIHDYIKNEIENFFTYYMIVKYSVNLNSIELSLIPYIIDRKNEFRNVFFNGNISIKELEKKMKKEQGTLLTTESTSGNRLYGTKTDKEVVKENQEYKEKMLNESKDK